jgi:sulfur carrier protein
VQILVNGKQKQLADGISVSELVAAVSDRMTGIAVAVNNEVVPRGGWSSTALGDGDRVDVVTAVQGG